MSTPASTRREPARATATGLHLSAPLAGGQGREACAWRREDRQRSHMYGAWTYPVPMLLYGTNEESHYTHRTEGAACSLLTYSHFGQQRPVRVRSTCENDSDIP
jgi:hypothetical protein